jgi:hypothetical protein
MKRKPNLHRLGFCLLILDDDPQTTCPCILVNFGLSLLGLP